MDGSTHFWESPERWGLLVGTTLGRIVDTEGHNFTARWLLALAAIYDGATRTEAAKLGGTILFGHAPPCQ